MKKGKNTESKANKKALENVKEGKVVKNKPKNNKLKEAVKKLEQKDLAPKIENANLKPSNNNVGNAGVDKDKKKNKKNKAQQKQQENQVENSQEQTKVENNEATTKKDKKSKKQKQEKSKTTSEENSTKELTEAELKKIEKKKAKKMAQKLKKQQKKLENKDDSKASPVATTNGVKKDGKPAKNNTDSANKVLSKKEKKAQKRQMIKEQKLAAQQTRDPAVDAATVFVGNVPVNTKRVQLVRLFKDFGPVNSIRLRSAGGQVLHKHKQRKSAGALNAYVVLKDKETAEKALSLNGVEFKGHHLRITLSTKSPQSHEKEEAKRTVFVGNLKYTATEESLREIFSSCGEIEYVRCLRDGDKGCKGVAYVCFKTPDAVGLALELNQTIVDERPINVERYSIKKLGAKEAREAQAAKEVKTKKGAKKRIDDKKGKNNKTTPKKKDSVGDEDKKPKKSEFRGVKVEGLKKKQKNKNKKKKSNDQMLKMAKKIAPKPKTE